MKAITTWQCPCRKTSVWLGSLRTWKLVFQSQLISRVRLSKFLSLSVTFLDSLRSFGDNFECSCIHNSNLHFLTRPLVSGFPTPDLLCEVSEPSENWRLYPFVLRSVRIWMSISFIHILNVDSKCKFYLCCSAFTNLSYQWQRLDNPPLSLVVFSRCQGSPLCDYLPRPSWSFFPSLFVFSGTSGTLKKV